MKPCRSPLSASNRLPGGTRRSSSAPATSNCRSFRRALFSMETHRGTLRPRANFSVSLSANDRITRVIVTRHVTINKYGHGIKNPGASDRNAPGCHVVGPDGLEPSTSSLSGKRSNQAELWARISRLSLHSRVYRSSLRTTSTPPVIPTVRLYMTVKRPARADTSTISTEATINVAPIT